MNLIELSEFEFLLEQPNPTFLWTSFSYTTTQPNLASFRPSQGWPAPKTHTRVRTGWGWDFNGYLKTGTEPRTPSRPRFGTRMENSYIFWDENGIEGARHKPALSPSLGDDHLAWKHHVFPEACRQLCIAEGYDNFY